jgi:hypothetical protein
MLLRHSASEKVIIKRNATAAVSRRHFRPQKIDAKWTSPHIDNRCHSVTCAICRRPRRHTGLDKTPTRAHFAYGKDVKDMHATAAS